MTFRAPQAAIPPVLGFRLLACTTATAAEYTRSIEGWSHIPDSRPAPGSPLTDAGRRIPCITDGFVGAAPDIGAYEFGGDRRGPGARRTPRSAD